MAKIINGHAGRDVHGGFDRLSDLPNDVIHKILLLLPTKTAAQTIVLSKTWRDVWHSIPNLDFDVPYFRRSSELFLKFVDQTLIRYQSQEIPISKLSLRIPPHCVKFNYSRIDSWIEIAMKIKVKILKIEILGSQGQIYNAPQSIFYRKSSIVKLSLCNCRLNLYFPMTCSLEEIALARVEVDEGKIQKIQMDRLILNSCFGLKRFRMLESHKIRELRVETSWEIEPKEVFIEAHSLEILVYKTCISYERKFDISGCKNLKHLELKGVKFTNNSENFPEFLLLETLILKNCVMPKQLRLSKYRNLRKVEIVLERLNGTGEVFIDTPASLENFVYKNTCEKYIRGKLNFNVDCKKMERLHLEGLDIASQISHQDFFLECTFLKDFFLINCGLPKNVNLLCHSLDRFELKRCNVENINVLCNSLDRFELKRCNVENVKVQSRSLERLTLDDCAFLKKVEIFSPNFSEFYLLASTAADFPRVFLHGSEHQVFAMFTLDLCCREIKAPWFASLRFSFNLEELGEIPRLQPRNLKKLVVSSWIDTETILEGFLWSCRPETLAVDFHDKSKLLKLCEDLIMGRKNLGRCKSSNVKCWRHYLKDVKIDNFENIEDILLLTQIPLADAVANGFKLIWQS